MKDDEVKIDFMFSAENGEVVLRFEPSQCKRAGYMDRPSLHMTPSEARTLACAFVHIAERAEKGLETGQTEGRA